VGEEKMYKLLLMRAGVKVLQEERGRSKKTPPFIVTKNPCKKAQYPEKKGWKKARKG